MYIHNLNYLSHNTQTHISEQLQPQIYFYGPQPITSIMYKTTTYPTDRLLYFPHK